MPTTRSRRALLGVADQVLSSGTNFLTAFIASATLVPEAFGVFVVAYAVVTIVAAAARAFLGDPLLAHLPGVVAEERRNRLAGSAVTAAALLGVVTAVLLAGVGFVVGGPLTWLTVFAVWLPGAFVADVARYVAFSRSDTSRALAIDATWAIAQGAALVVIAVTDAWSVGSLAAAWGLGALAAVTVLPLLGLPRPADPRPWLRESRYLSGWFTVISVIGQSQVYIVLLLAGVLLSVEDSAGLRAVQLLVYQPAVTFMAAMLVMMTPAFARRAAAGDADGVTRLRNLALVALGGLALVVLVVIPLRDLLLGTLFPRYTAFAFLVPAVVAQTALVALAVPFHARLRGLRRARTLVGIQVLTTTATIGAALGGAVLAGVAGLAVGMALAAVVSLVAFVLASSRAPVRPHREPVTA